MLKHPTPERVVAEGMAQVKIEVEIHLASEIFRQMLTQITHLLRI
jgi:hypothetical protein